MRITIVERPATASPGSPPPQRSAPRPRRAAGRWTQSPHSVGSPTGMTGSGQTGVDALKELAIKQAELYRQRSKASNDLVRLGEKASVAERKPVVDEILALQEQYNALAEQKQYFEANGQFQTDKKALPVLPTQKHELVRKRANLSSQISKARANIKKYQHNPAKLLQYQQKETQLKALLAEVDGRLTRE